MKQKEQQLNRACESCRILKVRCHVDDSSTSTPCLRCAKTGRACVFAPPQRRKPRRRTDARVAELEKEVRAMRLMLADSRAAAAASSNASAKDAESVPSRGSATPSEASRTASSAMHADKPEGAHIRFHTSNPAQYDAPKAPDSRNPTGDVVDRGVIPLETAENLFNTYSEKLNHQFPGISLPKNSTARVMRESKPALWLAVLAAASIHTDTQLAAVLNRELIRLLADRVFVGGEKSVELVEALHLTVIYYYTPPASNRLLFYQYSNLAAGMIIELGLVSKPANMSRPTDPNDETLLDRAVPEDLLERGRVMLSVYAYTSG